MSKTNQPEPNPAEARDRLANADRERLRLALLATQDGIWDWNLTTDEVYFDRRYYEMAGYEADEFPHRLEAFTGRIHPDDVDRVMSTAKDHLEGRTEHFAVEFRFRTKSGEWMWIHGKGTIVERDASGRPLRFTGTHRDITDRKRAEEALRESEYKRQRLFETMAEGVFYQRADGQLIDANPAALRMLGVSREEFLSRTDSHPEWDIIREDGTPLPGPEHPSMQALRTGKPVRDIVVGVRHPETKAYTWVSASGIPEFHEGEKLPYQVVVTMHDLTERKRSELALEKSEALLNEVGQLAKIGGWEMDLITRKATWTRETYDIVEIEPGDPIPGPDEHVEYYLPEFRERVAEAMRALVEEDQPLNFEAPLRTAKGNIKWVHALGRAVREGDRCIKVNGTLQDITDRKRAELKLRESEIRLQRTQQVARVGSWEYDLASDTFWGSDEARKIYALPPDGPFTVDQVERCIPERERVHQALVDLIDKNQPYNLEFEIHPADGTPPKFISSVAECLRDSSGKALKVIGSLQDITARRQAAERLEKINTCLLGLGTDHEENLHRLTGLCGELLGATCALYNRLEEGMLCSRGQWHTPPDYNPIDRPEGHICYDVILRDTPQPLVVENLPATPYARTDPNVAPYGLKTYWGQAVRRAGRSVGSLCVVFQQDVKPTEDDLRILGILASSISAEEERKYAYNALRESEARFRVVFDRSTVGKALTAPDGRLLQVNEAFARFLGLPIEKVQETDFMSITHPDDLAASRECVRCLLAGEQTTFRMEKRYRHRDGHFVWGDVSATLLRDRQDQPLYFITSILDITARKEAENKLRASEALYRSILNTSPDGIMILDCKGTILMASPEALKMAGLDRPESMVGRSAFDLIAPEDRDQALANMARTFQNDPHGPVEYNALRADGSRFDIEVNTERIPDAEGSLSQMVVMIRDVTERKQAEKELQDRMKDLERFNRAMVDRELRMIELKTEVNALHARLNEPAPYIIRTPDSPPPPGTPA